MAIERVERLRSRKRRDLNPSERAERCETISLWAERAGISKFGI
jgi:hypothetical protein